MLSVKFTHLINPYQAPPGSPHSLARPAVYSSIRNAFMRAARDGVEVDVIAAAYAEDRESVEEPAVLGGQLKRSLMDVRKLRPARRVPLFIDVLNVGFEAGKGDYLIYTNMDITLASDFYMAVRELVSDSKQSALAIKSWELTPTFDADGTPGALVPSNEQHHGYDCFVFPREWVPQLELGAVCLGAPWADAILMANLDVRSEYHATVMRDLRISYHYGPPVHPAVQAAYEEHNIAEALAAMSKLGVMKRPGPGTQFAAIHRMLLEQVSFSKRFERAWRKLAPRRFMGQSGTRQRAA